MSTKSTLTTNFNYLQPTGYKVVIDRKYYSNLEFFCQSFQHPGMTMGSVEVPFKRIGSIPLPGDKLTFSEVILTILLDEDMKSYTELYSWLEDLTDKNYTSAISSNRSDTLSPSQADITVGILNNKNILTKSILYKDCVPTQLGDLNFQSIAGGESFLTFPASFRFTYFEIK